MSDNSIIYGGVSREYPTVNYDPDGNKNNVYARRLNRALPGTRDRFIANPFTKLMQPVDGITKSKRFARDKLNISDINGTKPDVYKKYKYMEGRHHQDVSDIVGAQPSQLKQSKPSSGPDYKLYTKDINPDKWQSKRIVDPLNPIYDMPSKSGRMVRIGYVDQSQPKSLISPDTRRFANYVSDIEGAKPKKSSAISENQRQLQQESSQQQNNKQSQYRNSSQVTSQLSNNPINMTQDDILRQIQNQSPEIPKSHFSRFNTYQTTQVIPPMGNENQNNEAVPSSKQQQYYPSAMHSKNPSIIKNYESISKENYQKQQQQQQLQQSRTIENIPYSKRIQRNQNNITMDSVNQSMDMVGADNNKNKNSLLHYSIINSKHTNSQAAMQPNEIKNRMWNKAQEVGNSIITMPEIRVGKTNIPPSHQQEQVAAGSKRTLENSMFKQAMVLNSSDKNNTSFNNVFGQANPINNEIIKSYRSVANNSMQPDSSHHRNHQQQQNPHPYSNEIVKSRAKNMLGRSSNINHHQQQQQINTITQLVDNSSITDSNQRDVSPLKALMPTTTQKAYGNFMDSKQLDQLINQLKSKNKDNNIF